MFTVQKYEGMCLSAMDNIVSLSEEQDCLKTSPVSELLHERFEFNKMCPSHYLKCLEEVRRDNVWVFCFFFLFSLGPETLNPEEQIKKPELFLPLLYTISSQIVPPSGASSSPIWSIAASSHLFGISFSGENKRKLRDLWKSQDCCVLDNCSYSLCSRDIYMMICVKTDKVIFLFKGMTQWNSSSKSTGI